MWPPSSEDSLLARSDHRHRVPADDRAQAVLERRVAGERRLALGRDRVDVGRVERRDRCRCRAVLRALDDPRRAAVARGPVRRCAMTASSASSHSLVSPASTSRPRRSMMVTGPIGHTLDTGDYRGRGLNSIYPRAEYPFGADSTCSGSRTVANMALKTVDGVAGAPWERQFARHLRSARRRVGVAR